MEDEIDFGFSIRMSDDDKTANVQIRAHNPITNRDFIDALRLLADHLEVDSEKPEGAIYQ